MSEKNLNKLEGVSQTVKAGAKIIGEDEISRKMFIIKSGQARVFKSYLGQKVTLAVLGAGEVFGELSFFDAEPRSASVEALTDLKLVVIDGDVVTEQIEALPAWIVPIFKSVFHRFRELDQQTMVLQHVYEFQKKHHKTDGLAQSIYLELQRYIKTLVLLHTNELKANGVVKSEQLRQEMQDVLGEPFIGLRAFWRVMTLHDYIDVHADEQRGEVVLRLESIAQFQDFLGHQADEEDFMLLSRSAIAVLRRVVGHIQDKQPEAASQEEEIGIHIKGLDLNSISLSSEALTELKSSGLIDFDKENENMTVCPRIVYQVFTYQSIIKSFDHSTILPNNG